MARTRAISLIEKPGTKVELKQVSGIVIANVMAETISSALKSKNYTGNPAAGSVEFKRFKNSESKQYGTARTAGKGDEITVPPVTVNLDQHREIVEEAAKFDIDTCGVGNIMARRADNHADSMIAELDTAFFAKAVEEGTKVTPTETEIPKICAEVVTIIKTVKNEYVRGVPTRLINMTLSPKYYSAMKTYINEKTSNPNVNTAAEIFGLLDGVKYRESVDLPEGTNLVCMIEGAIAQPVVIYPYKDPEKIPLSNDYAVALFYDYGTKALTPDLIFYC